MNVSAASDLIKQPDRPKLVDVLGPGLITGTADDDPSGIATCSQAGAQFGYSLGWTLLLAYPLMCAIQMIGTQVGRVTDKGLAGTIRRHYAAPLVYPLIALLRVANVINLGAAVGAMAAFGTTISSYLFFWGAAEEVEDQKEQPKARLLIKAPRQAARQLAGIQAATMVGMGLSTIIAPFIMMTTAATLNAHGVRGGPGVC